MLKLRKVAITGGLASGKSSVCRFLSELGACVVSADKIVHQLLSPNTSIGQQVIALFGEEIVVSGQIDRSKIAKKVFNNQDLLNSLEKILHPAVRAEIDRQYHQFTEKNPQSLFVAEIPLLFEGTGENNFDATIAVVSDVENCRKRFMDSGYSGAEYDRRMAQQLTMDEKARRADFIIENYGTLHDLQKATNKLFKTLMQ